MPGMKLDWRVYRAMAHGLDEGFSITRASRAASGASLWTGWLDSILAKVIYPLLWGIINK